MSFFSFGSKAVILRVDHEQEVEVSEEMSNVPAANHLLSALIAAPGVVVLAKGVNDHDGSTAHTLERISGRVWGEVEYEVLPVSALNESDE